jgi:hypothetical protein
MWNCSHIGDAYSPPEGKAYNVFARHDNGAWVGVGGLNPQPGEWTDCHDEAHTAGSRMIFDLTPDGSVWEFRAILLSIDGTCDSSAPDVSNACSYEMFKYTAEAVEGQDIVLELGT